jgi:3-dehydroquinate synthase
MREITVGLGERAYPVLIGPGLIARAGELIAPYLNQSRAVVVTDRTVSGLHGAPLERGLTASGLIASVSQVAIEPGEQTKSFEGLASLCDELLAMNLDRSDCLIAFGGGVVGDLAGFTAAIYKRGIDFIQIPTTLLAQVDSSVGGKTAIDTAAGKNLIGAFHQPRLVLADLDVLATLPDRQMRAGYAEVIKYGLLGDADFFAWLEKNGAAVLARESEALGGAVARSVQMKAEIVGKDERETSGARALLNLGHTFGHALEAETGFGDELLHGEAVALGCALAFRFSARLNYCSPADAERASAAIAAAGLPTRIDALSNSRFSADRLTAHMAQDKKAQGGRLNFILVRSIGEAFVAKGVDAGEVRAFLLEEGAQP